MASIKQAPIKIVFGMLSHICAHLSIAHKPF